MIHPCDIHRKRFLGSASRECERWRTAAAEVGRQFTSGLPWFPRASSLAGAVVPFQSTCRGSEKGFLPMHREPIDRPGRDRRSS